MQKTVLALSLTIAFTCAQMHAIVFAEEPAQTLQSLLGEAREAQSRGDFNAAAESYRKATQLEPSVPELWANLGLMYHESGKPDEAIRSFKEAIRLKPSLFVPQLILGIEYLKSKNPEAAIPFLEKAEMLNPDDLKAALNLGKAYALLDRADRAADAYSRATQLAPKDGNTWLSLGLAYLQQVEFDARLMTSTYRHSPFVSLLTAETYADEGNLAHAENAYKSAIESASPAPCTHAEFGITLLREQRLPEAREQFDLESKAATHCGLATLGGAMAEAAEGHTGSALTTLTALATSDLGFVESSLPLFRGAVSSDRAKSLSNLARTRRDGPELSVDLGSVIEKALVYPETLDSDGAARQPDLPAPSAANAEKLYAAGQYRLCSEALRNSRGAGTESQLPLLVSCSFFAGDFAAASSEAQRLKSSAQTRARGLYWESKADQKLAIAAFARAGELDADSPRMHVLIGDSFRQARNWGDAEAEYRKAVALDPNSHSARLGLAIALFTELKTDEAFDLDRGLLSEDAIDAEANLLAGEILVQQNRFTEAEPYLSKCRDLKPEFAPRLHVLLGQVYAETNQIPKAISEYKAGLSTDEDGSIHYRLARLYQKSGYKAEAEEAFRTSKRLRNQWDERAHISFGQGSTELSNE